MTLPLTPQVTLSKSGNLSEPSFPHLFKEGVGWGGQDQGFSKCSLAPQVPWHGLGGIFRKEGRESGPLALTPQLPPDRTHFYLPDGLGVISTKGFTIFKDAGESLDEMSHEDHAGSLGSGAGSGGWETR